MEADFAPTTRPTDTHARTRLSILRCNLEFAVNAAMHGERLALPPRGEDSGGGILLPTERATPKSEANPESESNCQMKMSLMARVFLLSAHEVVHVVALSRVLGRGDAVARNERNARDDVTS
jgi:hypothetical protein